MLDFVHGGDFYVKETKGVPYVIFRGTRKLRTTIKGTRYSYNNPKMKAIKTQVLLRSGSMERKLEAVKEISKDEIWGVFIVATIDIIEHITDKDNKKDWIDLVATIFGDVIKLVVATIVAGVVIMLLTALFEIAIPVIAVIAASIALAAGIGMGLDYVDKKVGFTKAVDKGLHNSTAWIEHEFDEAKKWLQPPAW